MESIFIELDKSLFDTKKNIIVGRIYRMPDSSIEVFLTTYHERKNFVTFSEFKYMFPEK